MNAINFKSISLPNRSAKPRQTGKTMLIDYGLPVNLQADLMKSHSGIIDQAKFAGNLAGILPLETLKSKIELYNEHGISTFPGGLFAEVAVNTGRFEEFLDECETLGFTGVEVSNIRSDSKIESKYQALAAVAKRPGLEVIGEVGLHDRKMSADEIIADVKKCFEVGSDLVILEDKEIFCGEQRGDVLSKLSEVVDTDKLMIELPKETITGNTKAYRTDVLRWLVREYGPEISLGNVNWDELYLVEMVRCGVLAVNAAKD